MSVGGGAGGIGGSVMAAHTEAVVGHEVGRGLDPAQAKVGDHHTVVRVHQAVAGRDVLYMEDTRVVAWWCRGGAVVVPK
jgi:hypothetical protein